MQIKQATKQASNWTKNKLWPIIMIIAGYLVNVLYVLRNGLNLLNSDASSEMVLGRLLRSTGGIVTDKWYYSTELRVINTQLVYRLAMTFFPNNWHAARVFSVAVFLAVLILCALYLSWAAGLGVSGLWYAALISWPFGQWYAWNVLYNSYYIPHICFSMVAVGLLLQLLRCSTKKKYLLILLLMITGFVSGLGGMRQLMICYVPVLAAVLVIWMLGQVGRFPITHRAVRQNGLEGQAVVYALLLFLSALAGHLVNRRVFAAKYQFLDQNSDVWNPFSLTKVWECLGDLISMFGWQANHPLMSAQSVFAVFGLLLAIAVICAIVVLWRHFDILLPEERILTVYGTMAFLIDGLVYSQGIIYNKSYWVPLLPTALLLLMVKRHVSERLLPQGDRGALLAGYWKNAAMIVILICCSVSTMLTPYPEGVPDDRNIRPAVQWLVQNGYTQGYAAFWSSNIVTELSNGQIEMWTIVDGDFNHLEVRPWLQTTAHSEDAGQPQGQFFILMTTDEAGGVILGASEEHMVYADEHYKVYSFGSLQEYRDYVAAHPQ